MRTLAGCTLLSLVLLAGCACPPVGGNSGGGRGSGDPSGGTFAFLGGLKCFFGGDDAKEDSKPVDLAADKSKAPESETDHAAALTIR
jgi:hypothetical protein